ncbi:hypothetical protein AKJ16_DCAP23616 [Drosera capensis]
MIFYSEIIAQSQSTNLECEGFFRLPLLETSLSSHQTVRDALSAFGTICGHHDVRLRHCSRWGTGSPGESVTEIIFTTTRTIGIKTCKVIKNGSLLLKHTHVLHSVGGSIVAFHVLALQHLGRSCVRHLLVDLR